MAADTRIALQSRAPDLPHFRTAVAGTPHASGMAKIIDSNGADKAKMATLFSKDRSNHTERHTDGMLAMIIQGDELMN